MMVYDARATTTSLWLTSMGEGALGAMGLGVAQEHECSTPRLSIPILILPNPFSPQYVPLSDRHHTTTTNDNTNNTVSVGGMTNVYYKNR